MRQSGTCTAGKRNVLYSVLALGSMIKRKVTKSHTDPISFRSQTAKGKKKSVMTELRIESSSSISCRIAPLEREVHVVASSPCLSQDVTSTDCFCTTFAPSTALSSPRSSSVSLLQTHQDCFFLCEANPLELVVVQLPLQHSQRDSGGPLFYATRTNCASFKFTDEDRIHALSTQD